VVIYRSLEGINAAVVGIMLAATFYLMKNISFDVIDGSSIPLLNLGVIVGTFSVLTFTKIRAPFIVLYLFIAWLAFLSFYNNRFFQFPLLPLRAPNTG